MQQVLPVLPAQHLLLLLLALASSWTLTKFLLS
jgi:hypothetical protein